MPDTEDSQDSSAANPEGQDQGDRRMENALMGILNRLAIAEENRGQTKPKAIQCRMFKLGESWTNFSMHFVECIRTAHSFELPRDQAKLDAACLSWIASKLEPGPTLIAYQNVPATQKVTWRTLDQALTTTFADETEREKFLSGVSSFKRGNMSLLQYKNELMRLMTTYQPNLKQVPEEYDRQVVARFIEGLQGDELKRKLRRICKRDNCSLELAYNYVIDHEAAQIQSAIMEGEAVDATVGKKALAILTNPLNAVSNGSSASSGMPTYSTEIRQLRDEFRGVVSKQKNNELKIQEIDARSSYTSDRVDSISKEVTELSGRMTTLEKTVSGGFEELKTILTTNSNPQTFSQPIGQYQVRPPFRGQGRGFFRGATRPLQPSLTGGAGFVNNSVRPGAYRMQGYPPNMPVRPAPTPASETPALPATVAATNAQSEPLQQPDDSEATYLKAPTGTDSNESAGYEEAGWWSPGMPVMGAMGYDESHDGTYSYGYQPFYQQ